MALKDTPLFARGATAGVTAATDQTQLEGLVYEFEDLNWSDTGVKSARSGKLVKCMIVRNTSGINLLPGRLARFATTGGSPLACLARVDGYAGLVDAEAFAGVVDEWLPAAGVANNDLFYIVIQGPSRCLAALDGSAATTGPSFNGNTISYAIGDLLTCITAATSQCTTAGRVQVAALTFSITQGTDAAITRRHTRNVVGSAMSTRSSTAATNSTTAGITNQGILVDVRRW